MFLSNLKEPLEVEIMLLLGDSSNGDIVNISKSVFQLVIVNKISLMVRWNTATPLVTPKGNW